MIGIGSFIFIILSLAIVSYGHVFLWIGIVIVFLFLVFFLFSASWTISARVYVKAICKLDTHEKVVMLTYDDGPDPDHTPPLLDVLKKYDVKACFFCIGQKAKQYPAIVKRIAKEGHAIGNHSYLHENRFPLYNKQEMKNDLLKACKVLEKASGKEIRLFRPPFGITNPTVGNVLKELGWTTMGWSLRSYDTQATTADKVFHRIKRKLKPGVIILFHDRMPLAAELTEMLLVYLKENGYRTVVRL